MKLLHKCTVLTFVAIALAGCGARVATTPPIVTPPTTITPATVDVVNLLFSTPCRDIGGGTTVCDSIADNVVTRKTVTPGYTWNGQVVETWSIYLLDPAAGCIREGREETRLQAGKGLVAVNNADEHQCWGPMTISAADVASPLRGPLTDNRYTWTHYDGQCLSVEACTAANIIGIPAHGSFADWTSIWPARGQLVEFYQDTSLDLPGSIYCGLGTYVVPAPGGMISVTQSPQACN